MSNISCFSVSVEDIPDDELETALRVLTRSFNIFSMLITKKGGGGL